MRLPKTTLAYLALATGVVCLSFSSLFIRWSQAPGVVTSFFRMGIATTVMAPFFLRQARQVKFSKGIWIAPVLGGLFAACDQAIWSTSIGYTRVANATLLNNTAPVWVALAAWLIFREKLKGVFWLGLALAMGGATIVLGSDIIAHPSLSWGDLLALISGLFYAAYYLVMQRGRRDMSALAFMGLANTFSCLALLVICLVTRQPLTGFSTTTYLTFLGAALISQILGHLSLSYALGHLPASLVAPTMIAQPVLTALMAIPLLGESLHPGQWIGGISVLAGITLVNNGRKTNAA
jgi:drug/metabolite transporter (DMT)-like permease